MILHVKDSVLKEIEAHALSAFPEGCCGALLGDIPADFGQGSADLNVTEARRLSGAWEGSNSVTPESLSGIEKEFAGKPRGLLGFYHSHPDLPAWPSPQDLQRAWQSYAYLIVQATKEKVSQRRVWLLSYDMRSFEEHKLKNI
jgi:proteasome lid subunit RPN8/RPN11